MVTAISIVFANKGDSFGAAGSGEEHFLKENPFPVEWRGCGSSWRTMPK